jgi:hypothetical protein
MVKSKDVKAGDIIKADGGFSCIKEGAVLMVMERHTGELYVECSEGRHYLNDEEPGFTQITAEDADDQAH